MRACSNCGHENRKDALFCEMCGDVLNKRKERKGALLVIQQHSKKNPALKHEDFRRHAAKARNFLLELASLAALPFALLIAGWSGWLPPRGEPGGVVLAVVMPVLVVYLFIVYGFLIAKTSESCGSSFASSFIIGCVPPLTPALWARLGGRSFIRPYVYLAIDAAALWGLFCLFEEWPLVLLVIALLMIPLLMYHQFGCATAPLAGLLGLPPLMLTLWLCLGPDVLLLMALSDYIRSLDLATPTQPFALTLEQLKAYLNPDQLLTYGHFVFCAFVYAALTLIGWVKLIHDNLRLPLT